MGIKTVSYPKYLMEVHVGRLLEEDEIVHHIDRDFTNDDINNLEIKPRKDHAREHAIKYPETIEIDCLYCSLAITLTRKQQRQLASNTKNEGTAGPFCSPKCSGKYGTKVQYETRT